MTATQTMYPMGQHPYWCDLDPEGCGTFEPNHVGRTSHMFVQTAEGRITLQLSRHDVPGLRDGETGVGDLSVKLTMTDAGCVGDARAELSLDEIRTLALLCSKYVQMVECETRFPLHDTEDAVRENGPA